MRDIRLLIKSGIVLAAATVGVLVFASDANAAGRDKTITNGIYAGEVSLGGLNEAEANEAINNYVDERLNTAFTITAQGVDVTMTARDMGVTWTNKGIVKEALSVGVTGSIIERYKMSKDLDHENIVYDIDFACDETAIRDFVATNTDGMNVEPVNAGLKRTDGQFIVTPGVTGLKVDAKTSAEKIAKYMDNDWAGESAVFELDCEVTEPETTTELLERVHDIIGTYTTDFSTSSAARCQNVKNGASKINGTILYPGDSFSVADAVVPFTAENGYELAGSYENGTTVQTYGGGICQVSSTLYNAVLRAELHVNERYCHSMIVSYVDPSMDAAISEGIKDFKFTNDYDFPIYIEGYTSGYKITFNIYGDEFRAENRKVSYESEVTSTDEPDPVFETSADYAIGYVSTLQSAHVGHTARLWKIITVDGVEQSREIWNRSIYNSSPKKILVGIGGGSEDAIAKIKEAIEAKDETLVRSLADAYANGAGVEEEPDNSEDKPDKTDKPDKGDKKDNTTDDIVGDTGNDDSGDTGSSSEDEAPAKTDEPVAETPAEPVEPAESSEE